MGCLPICSECGKEFYPYRRRIFGRDQVTCASAECQRKRKSRRQRERREPDIVEALYRRGRSNVLHVEDIASRFRGRGAALARCDTRVVYSLESGVLPVC
jgi:hypothetical protein